MSRLYPASLPLPTAGLFGPEYQLIYHYARRFGLSASDAEDCTLEFLEHLWIHNGIPAPPALQRRRAHDFACDAHRARYRRARREAPMSELPSTDGPFPDMDRPDPRPTPEERLMLHAFWELLQPFLNTLPSGHARLLLGHYCESLTVRELAEETGRTVGAVEQVLVRTLRRLRKSLACADVGAHDLTDCLPRGRRMPQAAKNIFFDALETP